MEKYALLVHAAHQHAGTRNHLGQLGDHSPQNTIDCP